MNICFTLSAIYNKIRFGDQRIDFGYLWTNLVIGK
jgi:hypothetical protein